MFFSPTQQNNVRNVQTRIREIDMALHPSVKSNLGAVRTFTYSTLAGCCDFLDSVQKGGYTNEVEAFAKEVVGPVVEECFLELEKYSVKLNENKSFKINDESLKLELVNKLRKMQEYPERNEFKKDLNPKIISKLGEILTTGKFSFYKLNENDSKNYGGVLEINKEAFLNAVKEMEDAGYKEAGDLVGSSFDVGGHVTTIFSKELSENYDSIMGVHNEFVSCIENASIKPLAISYGFPQAGILSKAVVITVDSPEIDSYRTACGLGKLFPPAHVSIFTKVVNPLEELKDETFLNFIDRKTQYLSRLHNIFQSTDINSR